MNFTVFYFTNCAVMLLLPATLIDNLMLFAYALKGRVKTLTYVNLQVIFDCKNGKKQELLLFKM